MKRCCLFSMQNFHLILFLIPRKNHFFCFVSLDFVQFFYIMFYIIRFCSSFQFFELLLIMATYSFSLIL